MPTETFANLPPDKKQRVIDAALHEFSEAGYELASISKMVARAGIAKGSFYQYFESKADLFEYLLVDELGKQKLAFVQAHPPAAGSDFFATVEQMVHSGLSWALSQPRLARITEAVMTPSSDPDLRALAERFRRITQDVWTSMLRRAQEAGEVRDDVDLGLAAAVLTAMLQQGLDRALWERFGLDLVGLMREPEKAHGLDDDGLRGLVGEVVDLARRALGRPGGRWVPEALEPDGLLDAWTRR
jgi:AcrR family transcriptional regulator